jgi:fumarylacetoacetate (FAA) hydrolase family protein
MKQEMNTARKIAPADMLPDDAERAILIGRVWRPERDGPSIVTLRDGRLIDITSREAPTVAALFAMDDPAAWVRTASGEPLGTFDDILSNSDAPGQNKDLPWLLAPIDLQAVKAAGVTFIASLIERVIEEQARGATDKIADIRAELQKVIGSDFAELKPGSDKAKAMKVALTERGAWSQYLEVGIGPDAEVFTKAQPMSAVGAGADIGIRPDSNWNNPEPEIVLAVSPAGRVLGAALGNDVNLRDFEGRSALLLPHAKDNNASCSIGPFIRLFDEHFTFDDVRAAEVNLLVEGTDGFSLSGSSSMSKISRDPADLVRATIDANHQYPDGFVLFLGTMFVPVEDRGTPGQGFTHKPDDIVTISTPRLGRLRNRVKLCGDCPPWVFGISALMRNLAARDLL